MRWQSNMKKTANADYKTIQNRKALLSELEGDMQSKRENVVQLVLETTEVQRSIVLQR